MAGWVVEHRRGPAAILHGRPFPVGPTPRVTVLDVVAPAVVLGSSQAEDVLVEPAALGARGIDVARRRGGGGAVWLAPGAQVWMDVDLPRGHPEWLDDVTRSFWWLGDVVAGVVGTAVGTVAVTRHQASTVAVTRHMRTTAWSSLVCFAGAGPGEVMVGGRKVWGWSQRRTREGARFMGVGYLRWDVVPLLDVLRLDAADRTRAALDLGAVGVGLVDIGLTAQGVVDGVLAGLGAVDEGSGTGPA